MPTWEELKAYNKEQSGWAISDDRVPAIQVKIGEGRSRRSVAIRVGELEPVTNEEVLAIFKSHCFLVVTNSRGGLTGGPLLYGVIEDARELKE